VIVGKDSHYRHIVNAMCAKRGCIGALASSIEITERGVPTLAPLAALENSNSIGKSKIALAIALAIDSGFRKKLRHQRRAGKQFSHHPCVDAVQALGCCSQSPNGR
jgi:hypothetical protein